MRTIGVLVSGLLTALMAGLTIMSNQNWQPIWSSLLGVSLSAFVALLAINPLQEILESRRWARARRLIYPMFIRQLQSLANEALINITLLKNHKYLGSFDSVLAFDALVADLEGAIEKNGYSSELSDQVVEYVRNPDVEWSLGEIRKLLIPRLYLLAPNCKAVEKSLAFEKSCTDLIDAVIGHERSITGGAAIQSIGFVKSMRDLYISLAEES